MDFYTYAKGEHNNTVSLRRYLHMNPEISGQEMKTAATIAKKLDEYTIAYKLLPNHGLLGYIEGNAPGRSVALRADTDALAMPDISGAPYASKVPGMCHACGHDCHAAALVCAASMLAKNKDKFNGRIVLIFQPSEEEPPGGAGDMIKYGAMDHVGAVFAIHVTNELNVGEVSLQSGVRFAASLKARIAVEGTGGHGGTPHECRDAILAASAIVMNLQSIVSREMSPLEGVAITVGKFHGGTTFNAVADYAEMEATIKFFNPQLADKIQQSLTRIVESTAAVFKTKGTVRIGNLCMPVINDPSLSQLAARSAAAQLGDKSLVECPPWSVSEDFSRYLAKAPGVMAFVGGRNRSKGISFPNHHPAFDIDEDALSVASALYAAFAMDYLNEPI